MLRGRSLRKNFHSGLTSLVRQTRLSLMNYIELSWEEIDAEMRRVNAIRMAVWEELRGLSADYATLQTERDTLPKWTSENNQQSYNARRGIDSDVEKVLEKRREVAAKLPELSAEYRALLDKKAAILKNGVKFS